jgi:hypothetical protein
MPRIYISSDEFRDNLNQWVTTGRYASLDVIAKSRQMIPDRFRNYTKRLYLALNVDDDFINSAAMGRGSFNMHTTWTKDEMNARSFFRDPKNLKKRYNILITKNIEMRHQIVDLDEFATFMGVPQLTVLGFDGIGMTRAKDNKHVVVSKELLINRSDYTILSQQSENK